MEKMKADGVNLKGKTFRMQQTGTHAQGENPGFKPGSDYDHTSKFESVDPKYNKYYENQLNQELKVQNVDPAKFKANVYGEGTSNPGAYEGGSLKQLEHYNQVAGSEKMIRIDNKGQTSISRETPQYADSLNTKWKAGDHASAQQNYQKFAGDSLNELGGVDKILKNPADIDKAIGKISKEVSRFNGNYSASSAEHYLKTGSYNYETPPAARVADYIKKNGLSINDAKGRAGFTGSNEQLLKDFVKLLGL
jgi:hypothetical protein